MIVRPLSVLLSEKWVIKPWPSVSVNCYKSRDQASNEIGKETTQNALDP